MGSELGRREEEDMRYVVVCAAVGTGERERERERSGNGRTEVKSRIKGWLTM